MKNFKKIWIGIAILILLLFGASFLITKTASKENSSPPNLPLTKGEAGGGLTAKAILEIENTKYEAEIISNETVYDFMDKIRREGKINFKEKNYPGIGQFIEEINGVKGKDGKYWIYYVNGKQAQVGVSDYKLKNNDVISWKYEEDNN